MPYHLRDGGALAVAFVKRQDTATSSQASTNAPTSTASSAAPTSTAPTSTTTSTTPTSSTTSTVDSTSTTDTSPSSTVETTSTTEDSTSSTAIDTSTTSTAARSTTTSAPSSTTSAVTKTIIITSNGTVFTTAVTTSSTLPITGNAKKSSNTGAIVGGVVGGIAFIGIVILLIFWYRRRSTKHQFDDIFDPDHAPKPGRDHGAVDLDANPDAAPRPFEMENGTSSGRPTSGAPSIPMPMLAGGDMRQTSPPPDQRYYNYPSVQPGQIFSPSQAPYGASPYAAGGWVPTETSLSRGPSDPSSAYPGTATSPSAYPMSETGRSGSTNPTSHSHSGLAYLAMPTANAGGQQFSPNPTTQTTSSKSREAQSSGLHVANDDVNSSGPVMQHSDGGRLPAEQDQPTEVPPAYDTIPRDEPGSSSGPSASAQARAEAAAPEKGPRPSMQ